MLIESISERTILECDLTFSPSSLDSEAVMVMDSNKNFLGLYFCKSRKEKADLINKYPWNDNNKKGK